MKIVLASVFLLGALGIPSVADDGPRSVGSVSSTDAFSLNNVNVNGKGVASWPVAGADVIQTNGSAVMVTLNDGTQILVDANSKVRIVSDNKGTRVVVLSGSSEDWGHGHHHWCWSDSAVKTSKHKCGEGDHDHDWDDRCCPDH